MGYGGVLLLFCVFWYDCEQVQRRRASGEDRGGGDGVGVGHLDGMQGGERDGGELDGGDERGGAGRVFDGGELVRRGDGVELEGGECGDDGRSELERDGRELREREVRQAARVCGEGSVYGRQGSG